MTAVQKLQKQQLPVRSGFQDPCCDLAYTFEIMSDEYIQVLHNGYDHWLTIMKMKSLSLTVCMHASVLTKVKHQIAALLAT